MDGYRHMVKIHVQKDELRVTKLKEFNMEKAKESSGQVEVNFFDDSVCRICETVIKDDSDEFDASTIHLICCHGVVHRECMVVCLSCSPKCFFLW